MFPPLRTFTRLAAGCVLALTVTLVAGCGSGEQDQRTVVVATHDSWAMPKKVLAAFTEQTGYHVRVEQQGDAGELTNKLVLTKDSPIADAVFGVDNTFASRAAEAGILADYRPDLPDGAEKFTLPDDSGGKQLTPIDYGDVCLNVDEHWFREHRQRPPRNLDDLTDPAYRDLAVVPAATTSSPGLAFLLTTISAKGSHWQDYWKALLANGLKVDSGWTQAWNVDFTSGGGNGTRPIVLSYSSSPPDTIPEGGSRPTTRALLDTCFRQVEYAGVLAGADNPAGARAFVRFLLGNRVQSALPANMYVYPVDSAVTLPRAWAKWAKTAAKPWPMDPARISAHRSAWLEDWRDLVSR